MSLGSIVSQFHYVHTGKGTWLFLSHSNAVEINMNMDFSRP